MCAWIDYEERKRPRDYFLALGLFVVAMLCKISMALFPLVILLYAWWKRGRIGWRDLKSIAPFLSVSLVLGFTTVFAGDRFRESHLQSVIGPQIGGFPTHLALAGWSIAFYLAKALWPVEMVPIYPKWPVDPGAFVSFLPWPFLGGVLAWFWSKRASWGRHALLGVGFFLINLAPFIGLNSVTYMDFTWVMDHFLYLPLVGLIGLAVAALEDVEDRISAPLRPALAGLTAMALVLLAWESHDYAEIFIGPEKLWAYTVERNPTSWLAHNNLGVVLLETDRSAEAIAEFQQSLRLNPSGTDALNNLGFALEQKGRTAEAVDQYEQALKFNPHFALAHANLADALSRSGRVHEAIEHYEQALLVNPQDEAVRASLAKLRSAQKTP